MTCFAHIHPAPAVSKHCSSNELALALVRPCFSHPRVELLAANSLPLSGLDKGDDGLCRAFKKECHEDRAWSLFGTVLFKGCFNLGGVCMPGGPPNSREKGLTGNAGGHR